MTKQNLKAFMEDADSDALAWATSVGIKVKFKDGKLNFTTNLSFQFDRKELPYSFADNPNRNFTVDRGTKTLINLKNSPQEIKDFEVSWQPQLQTLEGGPVIVHGDFVISNNTKLKNFEHCPKIVKGRFIARNCNINDLQYLPDEIHGDFIITGNKLVDLKDIHKRVKILNGKISIGDNPIKSHILGLCFISGIKGVSANGKHSSDLADAVIIINQHLGKGRVGALAAQKELIEAGLEDYAHP